MKGKKQVISHFNLYDGRLSWHRDRPIQLITILRQIQADWVELNGNWYWKNADRTAFIGWLYTRWPFYYLKKEGPWLIGWEKMGRWWYYFHEDGGYE